MTRPSHALRYGVPVLAVAAAMLLRWPLWGVLGGELAFLFLWPVVIGCAWWGGLGPGLVATALSALSAAFFLLEPRFSFAIDRPAEMVGLAVFAAVNVAVSLLCGKLHRTSRQAESRAGEVARQREWLRVSLTSIGDAVIATDTAGRVSFLNPTAQVLTGWEPGAAQGQPLERVFPIINEQTRQPVENPVARVLREGVVVGLANHTVLVARDGTERPIEDSAAPIKADDGSIIGVILVFHDVSESRRAEALLRESEANYRNLFESMDEGYCVIEMIFDGGDHPLDYRFLRVNPAFERQTGITDAEGRRMREIAPGHEQHWFDIYGRVARTGETVRFENPAAALGRWYDVCAFRVGPPDRRHVGIVFTDITGRKQVVEALRGAEEQLRQRVAELAEADRRKDQFVMMLAHELRNPLAPIRNGLQLLQASRGDGRAVEQARRIMDRQIGHLARIIEDLLDVSRLMRGRVELRTERLDLGRLARTVADDQRPAFEAAGVSLAADLPELPVWVNADPTRLTQVVGNLLQNAAKFTDRGGTVAVRVHADAGRRQAVLSVRDTGVGIEPALLPRLFETFAQADTSLDRSKGGLGLGLSVVKGLVELHGGTVEARSDGQGRGSEFVVRLPLQPEPAAVTAVPAAPGRAPKRLRVLVVEDNRDAADSLKLLLEVFGYEVSVAYTGPDGVAAAATWQPEVVVCDIGLPGLDGYGVARELRRHPATATARLIAVTGYGGDDDRLKSREAGFDAHLTKPADPTALQDLLARAGSTA